MCFFKADGIETKCTHMPSHEREKLAAYTALVRLGWLTRSALLAQVTSPYTIYWIVAAVATAAHPHHGAQLMRRN